MVTGLRTSASAMEAQGERLAVLANNLANVMAAGFKADRVEFFHPLSSSPAAGSAAEAGPAAPLVPPPASRTRTDFSGGSLRETGNVLDLAIEGAGFFVVRAPGGLRLTRAGDFTRSAEGLLAAADGAPVLDERRQPVRLPDRGRIAVDSTGRITADGSSVGRLFIADPPSLDTLTKESAARFVPPSDLDLTPARAPVVRQGTLEQSNVNPVLTLVEMIDALRTYEAAQRTARGLDETLGRAVNDVGRP